MVAAIAQHMDQVDDAPALQFAQAGADVGARHGQGGGNFVGRKRLGRKKEQGVDLGNGAVDTPFGAHFAPVKDKFLCDWRKCCFSCIGCF